MLKGISPLISPDLLAVLARMGHGDEIILADAHFADPDTARAQIFEEAMLDATMPAAAP